MNKVLCELCCEAFRGHVNWGAEKPEQLDTFHTIRASSPHHLTLRELSECGKHNCLLCALLHRSLSTNYQRNWSHSFDEGRKVTREQSPLFYELYRFQETIQVQVRIQGEKEVGIASLYPYTPESEPTFVIEASNTSRPRDDTSSVASLSSVSQCLTECQRTHPICQKNHSQAWMPSRLIYVGREDSEIRLIANPDKGQRYMTLSHCWGEKKTLMLTTQNIQDFMQHIPLDVGTKTYLDAVTVTRYLGIEYLWIDSLCIMQNSAEDWQKECGEMSRVYKNSFCNIAALEAQNSSEGLFATRDPRLLESLIIQSTWNNATSTSRWITRFPIDQQDWYDEIEGAPVHRRAWVIQERLLSPRNAHFGKDMIYWECRKLVTGESMRPIYPSQTTGNHCQSGLIFSNNPETTNLPALLTQWSEIVCYFSECSLTYPDDKLPAISALAKEFKTLLNRGQERGITYLAGIWSCHIPEQLLWYVHHRGEGGYNNAAKPRPSQYRAPTWSWASVQAAVEFWPGIVYGVGDLLEICQSYVFSEIDDPFLRVNKADLEVDCHFWMLAGGRHAMEDFRCSTVLVIYWDVRDAALNTSTMSFFLMPVKVTFPENSSLCGLIVRPAEENSFQRVGTFELNLADLGNTFDISRSINYDLEPWIGTVFNKLLDLGIVGLELNTLSTAQKLESPLSNFLPRRKAILR